MKNSAYFTSLYIIIFFWAPTCDIIAQNSDITQNCKVLMAEISETYEGECKKGLAHGKGNI